MMPELQMRVRGRHSGAGAGIPTPIASVPDAELIDTLVAHGQPRYAAEQIRNSPELRLAALRFWCDVGDAGRGDAEARERVDYCRHNWQRMRAAEILSDDPRRGHNDAIDAKELLA